METRIYHIRHIQEDRAKLGKPFYRKYFKWYMAGGCIVIEWYTRWEKAVYYKGNK